MGNLSEFAADPTVAEIYVDYQFRKAGRPRDYLGVSILGDACARRLWLRFRQVRLEQHEGRLLRLFETGHLAEARFTSDLRNIGIEVMGTDPDTGEQLAVSFCGGHLRGHADGAALGIRGAEKTWHLLEYKTHSAKSFAKLTAEGVQKSKPMHYVQMQVYMLGLELTRAYYLAVNKDTDELYGERIHFDKAFAQEAVQRGERIIMAEEPPAPISTRPDWYECKWCDLHPYCHKPASVLPEILPAVNCRTCIHSTPKPDGSWWCEQNQQALSTGDEFEICPHHRWIPMLFPALTYQTVTHAEGAISAIHYTGPDGDYVNDAVGRIGKSL